MSGKSTITSQAKKGLQWVEPVKTVECNPVSNFEFLTRLSELVTQVVRDVTEDGRKADQERDVP